MCIISKKQPASDCEPWLIDCSVLVDCGWPEALLISVVLVCSKIEFSPKKETYNFLAHH